MDLWILYSDHHDTLEDNPAKRMLREAIDKNIEAELLFFTYFEIIDNLLYYKKELVKELPKVIFFRGFDVSLVKYFEENNVYVVNSSYTTIKCRDKWLTHEIVNSLNILSPKTILLGDYDYKYYSEIFNNKFILKYRHGAQGNNIFLINNEDDFNNALENIEIKNDYLVQECINSSYGKDVRVYLIGDSFYASCMRVNDNGFMSNIAQGGKSYDYKLSDNDLLNARKIKDALKGDIISVDFLFGENNELIFCEANTNAGFASFNFLGYPMRKIMIEEIKKIIDCIKKS